MYREIPISREAFVWCVCVAVATDYGMSGFVVVTVVGVQVVVCLLLVGM